MLRVTDNGCGLSGDAAATSVGGLRGMHEWALLVGGELDVSTRASGGVQVRLRVQALQRAEEQAA